MNSRRTPPRLAATLVVLPLAALALAGCGGSGGSGGSSGSGGSADSGFASSSAKDILAASKKDTLAASSVTISGSVSENGNAIELDLQLDDKGDCRGSLGIGQGTAQILGTAGKYWFKPDQAFWKEQAGTKAPQIIAAVGDKYVVTDAKDFGDICNLDKLLDGDDSDDESPSKVGTAEVDGQQTVEVSTSDDQGAVTDGYVLTASPHYLVKVESGLDSSSSSPSLTPSSGSTSSTGDKGVLNLSDFNASLDVRAPAAADVVDLNNLGG